MQDIAFFAIYLNLKGVPSSSSPPPDSDTRISYTADWVGVTDPNGLIQEVTLTITEDPDDPSLKITVLGVAFSEGMGLTKW